MTSQYQGYPYTNPVATVAPSLSADEVAAMAKWNDLPRRPLREKARTEERRAVADYETLDSGPATSRAMPLPPSPLQSSSNDENPGAQTSPVDGYTGQSYPSRPAPAIPCNVEDDEIPPVVYIDMPDEIHNPATLATPMGSSGSKEDYDAAPVVYIDIPESGSSGVSQTRQVENTEPEYVRETIFYDPFKDRRVSLPRDPEAGPSGSRLTRPTTLELVPLGSSPRYTPSPLSKSPYLSPLPDPIPISEFPLPPPSYDEIDSVSHTSPGSEHMRDEGEPRGRPQSPPRTLVITHPNNNSHEVGLQQNNRKFLPCPHCGTMVHTLVVKETGILTHFFAWMFMLCCMWPFTIAIYMLKCFKYRNHYCPNCNRKIAYQQPLCYTDMIYVS